MSFLLDTNACIAVINNRPEAVRSRLQQALKDESRVWISSIAAFELWYGVGKSSRPVTASVSEFRRVEGLVWQNWAKQV